MEWVYLCSYSLLLVSAFNLGDEFPHRPCDPLPPVTAVLYYCWLATGLHDKIILQRVGGHRVYVRICHPFNLISLNGNSAFRVPALGNNRLKMFFTD